MSKKKIETKITADNQVEKPVRKAESAFSRLVKIGSRFKSLGLKISKAGSHVKSFTKKAIKLGSRLKSLGPGLSKVGSRFKSVAKNAAKVTAVLGVLGGLGGWAINDQLISTAATFERFRNILETVEGTSKKAQKSMDWVSQFAAKTPYELDTVMDSFVKLRAYGLDPTSGLLKTLGDTASAMGKPITQAVEAIADAVTGENERLKEFGIKAQVSGDKIRYAYTNKAGNQLYKIVDKNNRKMIESTLATIWNEKYGGAMEKQSRTWSGMMSNLGDQFMRFKLKIMEGGLFDWMKDKLNLVLSTVDEMASNGSLQKIASDIGVKIKTGMIAAWQAGKALWAIFKKLGEIVSWVAEKLGGYERLAIVISGLMGIKLVASIGSLVGSLFGLGKVALPLVGTAIKALTGIMLTNPIGIIITAIALGAYLIFKYWDPIKGFFKKLWAGIRETFQSAWAWIKETVVKINNVIPDWIKKYTLTGRAFNAVANWMAPETKPSAPAAQTINRGDNNVSGTIKIQVESEGKTKVKELKSGNRNIDFDVDAGMVLAY